VETVTRVVVQELLEGEQADFLGGRGRYQRRSEGQVGSRNGYEPARVRTAEGAFEVAVPQVRGAVVELPPLSPASPQLAYLRTSCSETGQSGERGVTARCSRYSPSLILCHRVTTAETEGLRG
jgi:hypothetical protein